MATDPAAALQMAIVPALKALHTACGDRVYDAVPASKAFPYASIGPSDGVPVSADCYDGTETSLQIDVWSRKTGSLECKAIAGAFRERLHQGDLTLAGHTLEILEVASVSFQRDPDGLTSHGIVRVRAVTQPAD